MNNDEWLKDQSGLFERFKVKKRTTRIAGVAG